MEHNHFIYQYVQSQEKFCLLVCSKEEVSSTQNKGLSVEVTSAQQNTCACKERRVSVDVHSIKVSVSANKSVNRESQLILPLAKGNYKSGAYKREPCPFLDYSQPEKRLEKKRPKLSRWQRQSSSVELTEFSSSIRIKKLASVSEDCDTVPSSHKGRNFGQRLRQKLFGERRSKTVPDYDGNGAEGLMTTCEDSPHRVLFRKSQVTVTSSYKHPRVRFSTGLSCNDFHESGLDTSS